MVVFQSWGLSKILFNQSRNNFRTVQTQWNATARMYATTTKIESFDIIRKVLVTQESGEAIVARCAIQ